MQSCQHRSLSFEPSRLAEKSGYKRPSSQQLFEATQILAPGKKANPKSFKEHIPSTFPAPLVLPGDELSFDATDEPQTASECINRPGRNKVTKAQRTIYVVPAPSLSSRVEDDVHNWAKPRVSMQRKTPPAPKPSTSDVLAYLQAFYHGLPVKLLSKTKLEFVPWDEPKATRVKRIGLQINDKEVVGIRHRPAKDPYYVVQLNLNDLLDVAIEILPKDAHALLMLVDHDLYESKDDDFCCGRAYGGSRVAVVSYARYYPLLDSDQEVEKEHAWPASHCSEYMEAVCREAAAAQKKPRDDDEERPQNGSEESVPSAMHDAVAAFTSLEGTPHSSYTDIWLGRVCKTAAHELGHCVGIAHCVYYACLMQATSGLTEDSGQPPYLCPVDLAKVLYATSADEKERYAALLAFCERFPNDRMFSAFAAWLRVRLNEVESK